jgi:uncharacterized protein (TIGR02996 family)
MNESAKFVSWLRERVEPSLARARKTDDPFTAWLVLEDVQAAFDGRAAMLWGAVISAHVPTLERELGPWLSAERAALAARCEQGLLARLGLTVLPAPPTGFLASVKRFFTPGAAPSQPLPAGADLGAATEWAKKAETAVLGLLDHADPRVRIVVVGAQTRADVMPRLVARLEVEVDPQVAEALVGQLNARKVVLDEALRHEVGTRFPELKPVMLLGQLQASEEQLRELVASPASRVDALRALGYRDLKGHFAVRAELLLGALEAADEPARRAAVDGVRTWAAAGGAPARLQQAAPALQRFAAAGDSSAFETLLALSTEDATPAFDLVVENAQRTPPVLTGLEVVARARRLTRNQLARLEALVPALPSGPDRAAIEARLNRLRPGVAAPDERFGALAAAIDEAPDDVNAWLVWSDAVQGAGDVRGELVALAHANKPVRDVLERALPVLAPQLGDVLERPADILDAMTLHMGLPRKATFRLTEGLTGSQAQVVAAVLGAPLGRFVREVELGLTDEVGDDNDWGPTLEVLVRLGARVRSLLLGAFDYPDDSDISSVRWGDLSAVWSLSHLEALHVRGGDGVIGTIDSKALRSLTIETGGLSLPVFNAVLSAELPALESLTLWTGDPTYNGDSTAREAVALLDWAPTGLKRLGVENCAYTHELIKPFAKHPVLKRLEVLSFANGVLRPNEVDLLLQHQPAFAHLARLDLSANLLDDTSVETLARAFPNAVFDDQREDYGEDEDRYVAVGE